MRTADPLGVDKTELLQVLHVDAGVTCKEERGRNREKDEPKSRLLVSLQTESKIIEAGMRRGKHLQECRFHLEVKRA